MLSLEPDLEVVGVAGDYDELVAEAGRLAPQVLVTDIRMPPTFQREGIDAAKELRKRHPGTGVVILSQYDDPEYAVSLLSEGAAGYAYLLKDGRRRGRPAGTPCAGRRPAGRCSTRRSSTPWSAGGRRGRPHRRRGGAAPHGGRRPADQGHRRRPRPRPAVGGGRRRAPVPQDLAGRQRRGVGALRQLRLLHQAIVDREEQGETLSRLLPGGWPRRCAARAPRIGDVEELDVTVLMSDVRGYSAIAEKADPSRLAGQVNAHRAEMNHAVLDAGGTVMQFVGDAVMAVFGAPVAQDDHADRAVAAAVAMIERQAASTSAGRPRACRRSASASACRPGRWRPPCSARRSAWSTRWSVTP